MTSKVSTRSVLVKDCPHVDQKYWLCDQCLSDNYATSAEHSERLGLPLLTGGTREQQVYAVYTRWKALEKHGQAAISDLIENETDAAWWLDNRTALLMGSLNGKLGLLIERSRLQKNDPREARRRELKQELDQAVDTFTKESRRLQREMREKLNLLAANVERCRSALADFS